MLVNRTKAKLRAGETVYGCFFRYPDPSLIEVQGYLGWDFLVFDGEHGTLEPRDCENLVRAAEVRDVTPIVRVTTNSPPIILRYMDTGAQGVHVPWVNTAAEAEDAVRSVKYHPRGQRGLAGVRAASFVQNTTFANYVREANQQTLVVIHIETARAIDELSKTLEVDDIDVVFIGPTDLSHDLGCPGDLQHSDVKAAMQRIVDLVVPSKVALGVMVSNANGARQWRDRGARYVSTTFDAVASPAVRKFLSDARS